MNRKIQHIVAPFILVCYILVGAIGFWGVLNEALAFGTQGTFVSKSGPPSPQPVKVVWTQQKHFPSSSNDNIPVPALACNSPFHQFEESWLAAASPFVVQRSSFHPHENSPRAPPFFS
jgi:hypothetical protein